MIFRLAKEKDIDKVYEVLIALINKNYRDLNWNANYPNKQTIISDIKMRELFILEEEDTIIGAVVLNKNGEEAYNDLNWLSEAPEIYAHRFFVNPQVKGKGYGRILMEACENYLINKGYKSIRLDTFSGNKTAQKFYEGQEFLKVGQVFIKGYKECFYCYEKSLS